jgi:BirA family transcriptional regulator, biotin operon repressor / biotin---[acetyl-CoA-carboxylase] ligase
MRFSPSKAQLLALLADGRFHSGPELARQLGLGRTAVWGLIHELQGIGLEAGAVSGRGYKLGQALDLLDEAAIRTALSKPAAELLAGIEIHDLIDSTNARLASLAREGLPDGHVCLAEMQTTGRGRLGRSWQSPFAGGLACSVLWRFEDHLALSGLSLAAGVAMVRCLRRAGFLDVGLKWPNDVLWCGRKLGGILLEVSGEMHGRSTVVLGVGLNVRLSRQQGEAIDQPWVDLAEIGVAQPSRNALVAGLLDELLPLLGGYARSGLAPYLAEWESYHCYGGQPVILRQGDRVIRGRVAGINPEGCLLLDREDGVRGVFASGEVSLRLDAR